MTCPFLLLPQTLKVESWVATSCLDLNCGVYQQSRLGNYTVVDPRDHLLASINTAVAAFSLRIASRSISRQLSALRDWAVFMKIKKLDLDDFFNLLLAVERVVRTRKKRNALCYTRAHKRESRRYTDEIVRLITKTLLTTIRHLRHMCIISRIRAMATVQRQESAPPRTCGAWDNKWAAGLVKEIFVISIILLSALK